MTADRKPLTDELAPDPLVVGWLAEQREIRVVFADDPSRFRWICARRCVAART
jgi:hypothetical protein